MKTLKGKITAIVGLILVTTMGLITAYSVFNSNKNFIAPMLASEVIVAPSATISGTDVTATYKTFIIETSTPTENNQEQLTAAITFNAVDAQKNYGIEQLWVMLIFVVVGIVGTYYLVGKMLKPLHTLSQTAAEINEHKLNTQIQVPNTTDEVANLTTSFNEMLTRLDSSFEIRKNFAQNAAHELKTPLAVIKSSIQVLEIDENPTLDDYQENTKIIKESTEELIEIVERLLDLTQNTVVQKEKLSLAALIDDCLQELHGDITNMGLEINKDIADCDIFSSYSLLKSVLNNILSNAIKYNKQNGSIRITLLPQQQSIKIQIADTGIGIDQHNLEYICEPFFRVDESRSKNISGNGLGLSIVKSTLQKLGGTMTVSSVPEQGTTIDIELPQD